MLTYPLNKGSMHKKVNASIVPKREPQIGFSLFLLILNLMR